MSLSLLQKRPSFDKLAAHSSQPCNSSSENSTGKNKRGASLSPSEYKNTQNEGLKKSKFKTPVEKVNQLKIKLNLDSPASWISYQVLTICILRVLFLKFNSYHDGCKIYNN